MKQREKMIRQSKGEVMKKDVEGRHEGPKS